MWGQISYEWVRDHHAELLRKSIAASRPDGYVRAAKRGTSTALRLWVALLLLVLALSLFAQDAAYAQESVAACSQYHTVQRGDTLSAIARRYGHSLAVLQQMNGLSNPNRIYVGQRLCVQAGGGDAGEIPTQETGIRSVTALVNLRVRSGPGFSYAIVGQMRAGEVAQVTGISQDQNWWRIYCTSTASGMCFISAQTSLSQPVGAGEPIAERIHFAPGSYGASRSGTVQGDQRKEYVLRAMAGQTMEVQVVSGGEVNFTLTGDADGEIYKRMEVGEPYWRSVLPRSQDYRIRVGGWSEAVQSYTLTVTIY